MKTHNRILFHCLCCGRVVHAESQEAAPNCCGKRMTNAAAETVDEAGHCVPYEGAGETASETSARAVGQTAPR